jgi:hypothetical protein
VAVLQNDDRADVIVVGLAVVIVVDAVDARARRARNRRPTVKGSPPPFRTPAKSLASPSAWKAKC